MQHNPFLAVDENAITEEKITVEEVPQQSAAGRRLWFLDVLGNVNALRIS